MGMFSEKIDYFEHEAICVELAALKTVVSELPNSSEIFARAAELDKLTHQGEWIRSGNVVMPKAEYYAQFKHSKESSETIVGDEK